MAFRLAGGWSTDGGLWEARVPQVGLDTPRPLEMLEPPSQLKLPSGPAEESGGNRGHL